MHAWNRREAHHSLRLSGIHWGALAFSDLVHEINLNMLDLEQTPPLVLPQLIQFANDMADFQLRFQVNFVFLLAA